MVLEVQEHPCLVLLHLGLLLNIDLMTCELVHFQGLLLGKAVLDKVDLVSLYHVLLTSLLVQDVYLLDQVLYLDLILLELAVRIIDELILLPLNLL